MTPQEEALMAAYAGVEMAQRQLEMFNNTYLHWWEGDEPVTHSERVAVEKIQREAGGLAVDLGDLDACGRR